jgi:hypothetical protein
MVLELKLIETRSWKTNYRGELAIHASQKIFPVRDFFYEALKTLADEQKKEIIERIVQEYGNYSNLPTGVILGKTNLTSVAPTEQLRDHITPIERALGDYSDNRFGFITKDMQRFETPYRP